MAMEYEEGERPAIIKQYLPTYHMKPAEDKKYAPPLPHAITSLHTTPPPGVVVGVVVAAAAVGLPGVIQLFGSPAQRTHPFALCFAAQVPTI